MNLRVLRVLNNKELIISGGTEQSASPGDILLVLGEPEPVLVEDPSLGSISPVKAAVKVSSAQSRFSIAQTFRQRTVNVGGSGGLVNITNPFAPPKFETITETLAVESKEAAGADKVVRPGDRVVKWEGSSNEIPTVVAQD